MFQKLLMEMLVKIIGQLLTPAIVDKAKEQFICWLKSQVANTDNEIDDKIVEIIAKALEVESCPTPAVVPVAE